MDWPERVRVLQTNWIGRVEGARSSSGPPLTRVVKQAMPWKSFTTRPDTLWGATFMVLAPEHPLVDKITTPEHKERS